MKRCICKEKRASSYKGETGRSGQKVDVQQPQMGAVNSLERGEGRRDQQEQRLAGREERRDGERRNGGELAGLVQSDVRRRCAGHRDSGCKPNVERRSSARILGVRGIERTAVSTVKRSCEHACGADEERDE
eukprot:6211322-Pleurochrysis_carterae.AAC.1